MQTNRTRELANCVCIIFFVQAVFGHVNQSTVLCSVVALLAVPPLAQQVESLRSAGWMQRSRVLSPAPCSSSHNLSEAWAARAVQQPQRSFEDTRDSSGNRRRCLEGHTLPQRSESREEKSERPTACYSKLFDCTH